MCSYGLFFLPNPREAEELLLAHSGGNSWTPVALPVRDFVRNIEQRELDPPPLRFALLASLLALPLPPTQESRALPMAVWSHRNVALWPLASCVLDGPGLGNRRDSGKGNKSSLALGWDGGNSNAGRADLGCPGDSHMECWLTDVQTRQVFSARPMAGECWPRWAQTGELAEQLDGEERI